MGNLESRPQICTGCRSIAKYRGTAILIEDGTKTKQQKFEWASKVESHPIMKYAVAGIAVPDETRQKFGPGWAGTTVPRDGVSKDKELDREDFIGCHHYSFVACDNCIEPEFASVLAYFPEGWTDKGFKTAWIGPFDERISLD